MGHYGPEFALRHRPLARKLIAAMAIMALKFSDRIPCGGTPEQHKLFVTG